MGLIKSLKNLGLNEKEARVYVALLQLGKATAYSVAKHSGLKKPTTYVILDDLIDKGVVTKVPREKVTRYTAISPEDLFASYKVRLRTAEESALPELKALARGKKEKVRASYYEGQEGIKEAYKKLLGKYQGGEAVGFYAHRDTPEEIKKLWPDINTRFVKQNINRRVVITDNQANQELMGIAKKYDTRFKALAEEKYSSNISINIYKNITYIFSHRYLQGIIIENPDIARVMKQIFNLVWVGEPKEDKKEPPKGPTRVA